jgi:MATE family multidrug resistance protein
MPLALFFAFKLDLRARGLWAGLICGLTCQACALLVITVRTRWVELADAMREEKANYVA